MKKLLYIIVLLLPGTAVELPAQSFTEQTSLLDNSNVGSFAVGASMVDANSDGLMDLYRFQGLYLQQGDGTFKQSAAEAGLQDDEGNSIEGTSVFGAIFGDYDNDGYLDILFEDLDRYSRIFRGRGDGSYYQSNDEAGIEIFSALQGSSWADFDDDGFLDLFVGGDGDPSGLYLNNGDGTFENASLNVGYSPLRNVYGVSAADYDSDGDIDIYLASCSSDPEASTNMLFRNDGNAGFTNVAPALGLNDNRGSWAVVWADVNNDTFLDLFVSNQRIAGSGIETRPGYNRLYINDGSVGFTDMAQAMGVAGPEDEFTLGATAGDFNNDGWIDLLTSTNGGGTGLTLYLNNDGTSFTTDTPEGLSGASGPALSSGDANADGWLDLFVPELQGEHLFYNDGGNGNYLNVRLVGTQSNRSSVGARIIAHAPGLIQVREIRAGSGMTSQNNGLAAHFGLAEHQVLDSLTVVWPSGQTDRFVTVSANQELHIIENTGINYPPRQFDLSDPAADSVLGAPSAVEFVWGASSDYENESLTYRLRLFNDATGDVWTAETGDTTMVLPGSLFTEDARYYWTVDVTDGHSIIRSTQRIAFTVAIPSSTDPDSGNEQGLTSAVLNVAAYPNPFDGTVTIAYSLRESRDIRFEIFDVSGRRMSFALTGVRMTGENEFQWDGRDLSGREVAPGVYIYRMRAGDEVLSGKLVKM